MTNRDCRIWDCLMDEISMRFMFQESPLQLSNTQLESAQWLLLTVNVVLQHVSKVQQLLVAPLGEAKHQANSPCFSPRVPRPTEGQLQHRQSGEASDQA
jgi:hypothetical protein